NAVIADEVVCVFDAYEQSGMSSEYMYHGVKIVFTKEKETADSFIEKYVYDLYDKHTRHITVVTSDMIEQNDILGAGAYRSSSREMWRDLRENEVSVSKKLEGFNEQKPRTRIELSNEILEEFEKIRRGNNHKSEDCRSEEHTSELQSRFDLVCRLLLEKKKTN